MIRVYRDGEAITLPGTVAGLLRRGSPVVETGESGINGWRGVMVPSSRGDYLAVRWEAELAMMETSITGGTALDLSDPTARFHALLWLAERGHPAWWVLSSGLAPWVQAGWLAASVLGGKPIAGVLSAWQIEDDGRPRRRDVLGRFNFGSTVIGDPGPMDDRGPRWVLWNGTVRDDMGGPTHIASGPETGTEGKAAADRAALGAGFALLDGTTLTVEIPDV